MVPGSCTGKTSGEYPFREKARSVVCVPLIWTLDEAVPVDINGLQSNKQQCVSAWSAHKYMHTYKHTFWSSSQKTAIYALSAFVPTSRMLLHHDHDPSRQINPWLYESVHMWIYRNNNITNESVCVVVAKAVVFTRFPCQPQFWLPHHLPSSIQIGCNGI